MKIGVLSLQGDYQKHIGILNSLSIQTLKVRYREDLDNIDALIIPGGESSTLSKLIKKESLYTPLKNFIITSPVYGTCAGLILLTQTIENDKKVKTFNVLSMLDNSPVMIQENKILGTTFHPELTDDTRIHEYFINMVNQC